jgi:hypothetical protein
LSVLTYTYLYSIRIFIFFFSFIPSLLFSFLFYSHPLIHHLSSTIPIPNI